MTVSADTLALLLDAGLSGDQLIAVVRSIEADAAPVHSSGAERQRRYRERLRNASDVTGDVTRDVTDGDADPAPSPPSPKAPQTPKKPLPPHPHPEGISRTRKADPFPKPDWADPQHWQDFLANRRRKKLTNTATAYQRFLDDIAKLTDDQWPPGRLLEYAAGIGWGAIYDPRKQDRNNGYRQPASDSDELTNPMVRAVVRRARRAAEAGEGPGVRFSADR